MSNDKLQPMSIDFLLDEFIKNGVYLSPYFLQKFREAKQIHNEEMQTQYQDGREAVILESIATLSTIKANSYSNGFNDGYMKALGTKSTTTHQHPAVSYTIENKIPRE